MLKQREASHSPPAGANVKYAELYNHAPHTSLMALCTIKHMDNFALFYNGVMPPGCEADNTRPALPPLNGVLIRPWKNFIN
jgi:hypothetical protein